MRKSDRLSLSLSSLLLVLVMLFAASVSHAWTRDQVLGDAGSFSSSVPAPARAANDKWFWDGSRGQLALSFDYAMYSRHDNNPADDDHALEVSHEFVGGLNGAWNIVDELDAAGFVRVGLDSKLVTGAIGLRYTLPVGAAAKRGGQ